MSDACGVVVHRLMRAVWTLYPPRFRRRFVAELEQDLRLAETPRRQRGAHVIDALVTLVRLWAGEARRTFSWSDPGGDVRLALRSVRHAPGYSFIVVAILAVALGGNTAVFSVAHAVLLKSLPYGDAERVVDVSPTPLKMINDGWVVDPEFAALEQVEAAALYVDGAGANLSNAGASSRVTAAQVTEEFFRVLGVDALLGTERLPRDERAVVISHAFWVQTFGADASAVGAELELNGRVYRVAGVMPAGVAFPSPVDLWLPFPVDLELYSNAVGPDGLALLAADADADAMRAIVADRVRAQYADVDREPPPVRVTSLRDELTGDLRTPLLTLMAIAGLLVLLGCFNLAGVVLSRNAARTDELSVRRALGAGRVRLFVQLLVEVTVLAILGGIAGIAVAWAAAGLLRRMLPGAAPGMDDVAISLPVAAFAAALTLLAALAVGVLPAVQGAFVSERPRGAKSFTEDRRSRRLQAGLVIGQVALAFVLVAGAALLSRSLRNLEAVPLGYDLEHVLTFQVRLPETSYPEAESRGAYLRDLRQGIAGIAGVTDVGATTFLPQQAAMGMGFFLKPPGAGEEAETMVLWVQADRGYFRAMGIPVLQGDPFGSPGEHARGMDRLTINKTLADQLFPEDGAVAGRAVTLVSRNELAGRIDAVVGDVRLRDQRSSASSIVYTDVELSPSPFLGFAVRAQGDPATVAERVRAVAASIDRAVAPFDLATTAQSAARQIAAESAVARLSQIFSASALVLAALGLYGLVSQGVVRRRRELGIRLALGARPGALVRDTMSRPLLLTALGSALGLAAALTVAGQVAPLLFEVAPRDPALLGFVAAAVLAVAGTAAFLSGRAALGVDPAESLRRE